MHVEETAEGLQLLLSYSMKRVSMSAVLLKVHVVLHNTIGVTRFNINAQTVENKAALSRVGYLHRQLGHQ